MNKVTFTNQGGKEWLASTGELIGWYSGSELWGRGSTGWYITEVNGEFRGIMFDTMRDAKKFLVTRYEIKAQVEAEIAEFKQELAKAN